MNIFGHHIVVLNDVQKAIVDKALADAGHELKAFAGSEISKLWAEAKAAFPQLVDDIKKGIADLTSHDMPGGQKAVAVAEDVLKIAPDVIQALPNAKDFLVHGVTEVYADSIAELEHAAGALVGTLVPHG